MSTLDLLGSGLTLFTGPAPSRWAAVAATPGRMPIDMRQLDAMTARALGIQGGRALLPRPDGVPVSAWSDERTAHVALRAVRESVAAPGPSVLTAAALEDNAARC